jgi:hypothetical protein
MIAQVLRSHPAIWPRCIALQCAAFLPVPQQGKWQVQRQFAHTRLDRGRLDSPNIEHDMYRMVYGEMTGSARSPGTDGR